MERGKGKGGMSVLCGFGAEEDFICFLAGRGGNRGGGARDYVGECDDWAAARAVDSVGDDLDAEWVAGGGWHRAADSDRQYFYTRDFQGARLAPLIFTALLIDVLSVTDFDD